MADRDEKVMALVQAEIEKNPDVGLDDLFAKAKKMSPEVGELTPRQFNARYPLQVKRRIAQEKAKAEGRPPRRRRKKAPAREAPAPDRRAAIRQAFLDFATELADADGRAEVVRAMAKVDEYVERVTKA